MIRLNDVNKTVIDESKVVAYDRFADNFYDSKTGINKNMEVISLFVERHYIKAWYESKEARDKDIELLDKLFDVEDIEYKAMCVAKPELYSNEGGINEEYLTWDYVKQSNKRIKAKLPNGDTHTVTYDEGNGRIQFEGHYGDDYDGCIYEEDLFNALMLKKVE